MRRSTSDRAVGRPPLMYRITAGSVSSSIIRSTSNMVAVTSTSRSVSIRSNHRVGGARSTGDCTPSAPRDSGRRMRCAHARSSPTDGIADAVGLPAEDPDRPRLRRRDRVAARARREPLGTGSATRCCSSARTCSRSSASSCAAPTTRWPASRAEQLAAGVICASAGNHAQGVALERPAARLRGRDRHAGRPRPG